MYSSAREWRLSDTITTDESIFSGETEHLFPQTVFHIYDYLKIWHKNAYIAQNVLLTPRSRRPDT